MGLPASSRHFRLVVSISIPLVALVLLWERARSRPLTACLLAAAYWLVLVLAAFARKIWRELEPRWAKSCADWVDGRVRLALSRFRRRYYERLMHRHRVFNVRGIRAMGTYTLQLEQVFVELRVAPQNPQEATADLIQGNVKPGNRSIWDILVSEHQAFRSLAVIGPPGSGKTTLLQHLSLVFSRNKQRRYDKRCRAYVPIVLFLREHVRAVDQENPPTLAEVVHAYEDKEGLKPPTGWFEAKLRKGKCLVLLDGLDEVAEARARSRLANWVDKQMERYPRNRFITSSRPHGYKANPLREATVVEVQPFRIDQIERFLRNWYAANEILRSGSDDHGIRADAERKAVDLLERIRSAPPLAALAVNPLLLTMIAMVHSYCGTLPAQRVGLYAEIMEVLLGRWTQVKGIAEALTPAQKRAVLQPLALRMMELGITQIPSDQAVAAISEPLTRVARAQALDPAAFLEHIQESTGLFLEREPTVYAFAHHTVQEYLAAAQIADQKNEQSLVDRIGDSWWSETIRLYCAQVDATGIVRACLERISAPEKAADASPVAVLLLAHQCAEEARSLSPEVVVEVRRALTDGLESETPEKRRLAAEVLLELRLGSLVRLGSQTEIDARHLSCAEYQLFVDETRAEGAFRQPDHWCQPGFPPGAALRPVRGVRPSDAVAFCEWLTERARTRGHVEVQCRLPDTARGERQSPAADWQRTPLERAREPLRGDLV